MPISRLMPILEEFGEYPEAYRPMIWRTILKLPQNYNSFGRLLKRELHACVANYDKILSSVEHKAIERDLRISHLKKIVSCLAHWTSIFAYVNYLPKFVFPFLMVCKGDLMLCFELIATLLLNHYQLMFEFLPSQMPYNYLCLTENILKENDRKLFDFYQAKNVSAKMYAFPLIETAFSEVFSDEQWCQLWDHIVSNDPCFMVFVIVAYNISLRFTIMRYENIEGIERMFHEQNYVNIKKLLSNAYRMMEKCDTKVHPKRYLKSFSPLARNEYQKFENYPKNMNAMKVHEIDSLRQEQKVLDEKLSNMESFEKTINTRLESYLMDEEYQKRMQGT